MGVSTNHAKPFYACHLDCDLPAMPHRPHVVAASMYDAPVKVVRLAVMQTDWASQAASLQSSAAVSQINFQPLRLSAVCSGSYHLHILLYTLSCRANASSGIACDGLRVGKILQSSTSKTHNISDLKGGIPHTSMEAERYEADPTPRLRTIISNTCHTAKITSSCARRSSTGRVAECII